MHGPAHTLECEPPLLKNTHHLQTSDGGPSKNSNPSLNLIQRLQSISDFCMLLFKLKYLSFTFDKNFAGASFPTG